MELKRSLIKTIVLAIAVIAAIAAATLAWLFSSDSARVSGITASVGNDGSSFSYTFETYDTLNSTWITAPMNEDGQLDTSMLVPGKEMRYRVTFSTTTATTLTMKLTNIVASTGSTFVLFTDANSVSANIPKIAEALNVVIANHGAGTAFTSAAYDGPITNKITFNASNQPVATLINGLSLAANQTYSFEYALQICKGDEANTADNLDYMGEAMTAKIEIIAQ